MPFTLSHPAASVPFARKKFILSALVIGSMAPDFEYFFPLMPAERFGHSLPGLVLFTLPVAVIVYFIFHALLKEPLVSLLPQSHQRKLMPLLKNFSFGPPRRMVMVLLSILIGILTHLIWDSFTHLDSRTMQFFPVLKQTLFQLGPSNIPIYAFLQYISSLVGIALLVYWYVRWYRDYQPQIELPVGHISESVRILVLISMIIGIFLSTFIFTFSEDGITSFPVSMRVLAQYFHDLGVLVLSVLLVEIVVYSVVWRILQYKTNIQNDQRKIKR
jgi:hypothetical protein